MERLPTTTEIDETLNVWSLPPRFAKAWPRLQFPSTLEQAFEAETGKQRSRNLALLSGVGIVLSVLFLFTDYIFTPYLFLTCVWLRLVPAPIGLFLILRGERSSVRARETALSAVTLSATIVIAIIASISRESLSVYTYYLASFCAVSSIIGFPMRFNYASMLVPLALLASSSVALFFKHPSVSVLLASQFVMMLPMPFALMSNYRSERAIRVAWLLSTREALRLAQLQADRENLEVVARTDGLTGLANRGHFDRYLRSHLVSQVSAGRSFWLIMIDVDFFKRYNDAYGHPAGDACLRHIARILSESVRGQEGDLVFRYGGEEFGILLSSMTDAAVLEMAERVREKVQAAAIQHGNRDDGLDVATVSVGVGRARLQNESSLQRLIEDADGALYQAKQQGRNRVCVLQV